MTKIEDKERLEVGDLVKVEDDKIEKFFGFVIDKQKHKTDEYYDKIKIFWFEHPRHQYQTSKWFWAYAINNWEKVCK